MQFFFYCEPDELKEVFEDIESQIDIVYHPRLLNLTGVKEIDELINLPLNSYKDFYNFGQIYPLNEGFLLYCPSDPLIGTYLPTHFKFSGQPYSVADSRLICEGTLYMLPENKNPLERNIYKSIRRCISKRFKKVGYAFLSPTVYERRHEVIFLQQNANTLASPWYMDDEDTLKPIRINDYYEAQGETLEQRRHHDWNIYFFAQKDDFVEICGELEKEYNLKYFPCGKFRYQFNIQSSIHDILNSEQYQNISWVLYEETHRLLLHLKMCCSKKINQSVVESSQSCCSPNPFGVALYEAFLSRVKERFYALTAPNGEIYYISPRIYPYRHKVTFRTLNYNAQNFDFRIDANDNLKETERR